MNFVMTKTISFILLVTTMLLIGCKSSQQQSDIQQLPTLVAPNHCRVMATVVGIDSTLLSRNADDACSKVPCRAYVRIDSVLGYGSSFTKPFSHGQTIVLEFRYTLYPTATLFPKMQPSYPGLNIQSRFIGDVRVLEQLNAQTSESVTYEIFSYMQR